MTTSPDAITYPASINEIVGPSEGAPWEDTLRPTNPWVGLFGFATNTNRFEFYDGQWRHPVWAEGGTFTGPVTFEDTVTFEGATIQTDGTTVAGPTLTFSTVADMLAFDYSTMAANTRISVTTLGYYVAGDAGGAEFDFFPSVALTVVGTVASGVNYVPVTSTTGAYVGQVVFSPSIGTKRYVKQIITDSALVLTTTTTNTITGTITLTAAAADNAYAWSVTGGTIVRRMVGREMSFDQAGFKGDYFEVLPYLTNSATTSGATLRFADTSQIQVGMWAWHPNITPGTTVLSKTSTTVTISANVLNYGVVSGTYVNFNPPPTDNTDQFNTVVTAFSTLGGVSLVQTPGLSYYFGSGASGTAEPMLRQHVALKGRVQEWASVQSGTWQGWWAGGIRLKPGVALTTVLGTSVSDMLIVRAGLPREPTANTTAWVTYYCEHLNQMWKENGVFAPESAGIRPQANQGYLNFTNLVIIGFNTAIKVRAGTFEIRDINFDCANGLDISTVRSVARVVDCWGKSFWLTQTIVGTLLPWYRPTAATVSVGGSGYAVNDLLKDEWGTTWQVATVAGTAVATVTLYQIGFSYIDYASTPVATVGMTNDPFGNNATGVSGKGAGCTLALTTTSFTPSADWLPGVGFHLHDDLDGIMFNRLMAKGYTTGYLISNAWVYLDTVLAEGQSDLDTESVGMWFRNSSARSTVYQPAIGAFVYPLRIDAVDNRYATYKARSARISDVTIIGGFADASGNQPCLTIGDNTRGRVIGTRFNGVGTDGNTVVIGANAQWQLQNIGINSVYLGDDVGGNFGPSWYRIHESSRDKCEINGFVLTQNLRGVGGFGTTTSSLSGPGDRKIAPLQIIHDPDTYTPYDGSPGAPLTVQNTAGGAAVNANINLARGGTVADPAIVGTISTSNAGVTIAAVPTNLVVTAATIAVAGAGYNIDDILEDETGAQWFVVTVDATGGVTAIANKRPGYYTGAAPANPVATTNTGVSNWQQGTVTLTLSGGGVATATVTTAGAGLYNGRTTTYVGGPGNRLAASWTPAAGTPAVVTPTITAGVVASAVVSTAGTGYAGVAPACWVVGSDGAGCTLNLTAGVAANTIGLDATTTSLTGELEFGAAGPTITTGAAAPGATEPVGSVYLRTGGGVGTTLYVSQGAGVWNAVAGV